MLKKIASLFALVVFALCLSSLSSSAFAQNLASAGGCTALSGGEVLCTRVSASVFLGQYNFTTGKMGGGVTPAGGYGVSLTSGDPAKQWLEGAFDLYLGAQFGQTSNTSGTVIPNNFSLIGVLSFADTLRIGFGPNWIEQPSGPAKAYYSIYFGLGSSFGEEANKTNLRAAKEAKRAELDARFASTN